MWGNYTIKCAACDHSHYRVIDTGVITDDRHNERMGDAEVIIGLKSTLRDTPDHNDPYLRREQMRLVP